MRFLAFTLVIMFCLCGCQSKDSYDWHVEDRARFMRENRSAVRIISVDDEEYERRVKVEGIVTKEQTWACFQKRLTPKVGEIWKVGPITDCKIVWLRLTDFPVVIE
jgi:hypothetical protein